MEKLNSSEGEGHSEEAEEEIILTTTEKELIRAITRADHSYFEDLGGLEYNINFKIAPNGINPLLLAASLGNIPLIQMIMANQMVRLNHCDNKGENAIFYATSAGHLEVVKELRKRGCPLGVGKVSKNHPAHVA